MIKYEFGPLAYYRAIAPESFASAAMHEKWGWNHDTFWTETWTNYLSSQYFSDIEWNYCKYPVQDIVGTPKIRQQNKGFFLNDGLKIL